MQKGYVFVYVVFSVVVGCGGASTPKGSDDPHKVTTVEYNDPNHSILAFGPIDSVQCAGTIGPVPEGVQQVEDNELVKSAVDATGKGKLCTAKVYEVVVPVKVYRVWNSQKTYTELGKWWSFAKPAGPVDAYRAQNAICPEWSDLDRLSVCELKVGARFAVGPGQSADCASTKYEKSAVNQVFIPNDTRENKVFVDHCEQLGAFP